MESEPYIFFYLLPRIRSIINCNLYDSIINGPDSINFLGFSKYEMNDLINSDAVIIGEVVEKKDIFDSTKCYYFKRDYIIKVDEVLHSYFSLNINDRVLFKSPIGIAGGCNPSQPNVLDHSTHLREFNVGDKWIFFLKHNTYYIKFITTINRTNHYSDIYCPHAFYKYEGNGLFDFNNISIINAIREFYRSKF
jgi:hypothetical protein